MTTNGITETMLYSPVNWLIVDWGQYNREGLPHRRPDKPTITIHSPDMPRTLPVTLPIETYDYARWLPEIEVGIDDPTDEIAADYARAACIEFAKATRALQRQVIIPLQHGEDTYPITPYDFENVIGVIGAGFDHIAPCRAQGAHYGYLPNGVAFTYDQARSEIHITDLHRHRPTEGNLRLLVWAAPKEESCEFDSFLYNHYRRMIVMRARFDYVQAVHFRDTVLVRSLTGTQEIDQQWAKAKLAALSAHSFDRMMPGSGLFSGIAETRRWR